MSFGLEILISKSTQTQTPGRKRPSVRCFTVAARVPSTSPASSIDAESCIPNPAPGTIDADYRGEIGVILVNLSNENFTINDGDRIAQLIIARYAHTKWEEVSVLDETKRGQGGFGSTGI